MNPDWQWWLWSDKDNRQLIAQHYPWFLDVYDGYPEAINRADAVRFFYLHRYGGLYMDLDFACLRPLDALPWHGSDAIFSFQYPDDIKGAANRRAGAVANNFMGAAAGHPFLTHAIAGLRAARDSPLKIHGRAGPNFLTSRLRHYHQLIHGDKAPPGEFRNSTNVIVFSQPIVYASSWMRLMANPCARGEPADLEHCRTVVPSVLTTFWTRTWVRLAGNVNKTAGGKAR